MSSTVFSTDYADQYDLLYGEKDYESECDLLEDIFSRFSETKVSEILDLGCGTGNHVIPLARRGYAVTGVDLSPEMLAHAREKAKTLVAMAGSRVNVPAFFHEDLRTFVVDKSFDAVLMMFAVLGYQLENAHVEQALRTVRKHLAPGGLFVFDIWYGPAVLSIQPSDRIKIIPTPDGELIRAASGSLDTLRQLAEVRYRIWRIRGKQIASQAEEQHRMRYFFAQELAYLLQQAGLKLLSLTAFPSLDTPASQQSWNALGIARAVSA